MGARAINAVLGLWLFLSAFLWEHGSRQFHNAWIVAAVVISAALAGLQGARWGRRLNATPGGWLVITALFWSRGDAATFWNHTLVGIAVALFAFAPSWSGARRRVSPQI
jgi:hypothetical protein